jgi:hypothetical protein
MRKFAVVVYAIAAVSFIVSCNRDLESYSDEKYGIEIKHPKGWAMTKSDIEGVVAVFNAPEEKGKEGKVKRLVVTAGELPENMNESKIFAKEALAALVQIIFDMKMIDEREYKAGSKKGWRSRYTGIVEGKKVMNNQIFFSEKGFGYSVIFSVSAEEYSADEAKLAERVLSTFRFTVPVKK